MTAPEARIRVRPEGALPPESAEWVSLLMHLALVFCAQPSTYPAFIAYCRASNDGAEWLGQAMDKLTPGALSEAAAAVAAGVLADYEEAGES